MNTRASRLVQDISRIAGELDTLRNTLTGLKDRYVSNGGQAFIDPGCSLNEGVKNHD